jgi:ribonucleoside-diphosphate reductase alpha chain/ribonucleoside-triphosphate reductase
MTKQLLTNEFIEQYPEFPAHMNALGTFVYYRTYSRFLPEKGRRETWKETCRRAVEYNVGLGVKHTEKMGYPVDYEKHRKEAEELFDSMFNLRQFLSGRTLWVGGAENGVADKYPLANFNCSFVNIRSWDDLGDLFYLLLVGTGVGFKSTKEFAANLPPIRTNVEVIHEPYTQRYPLVKQAETQLFLLEEKMKAVIHVGDSKEGWVESLRTFFRLLTEPQYNHIQSIGIYYDYVRPKGARLNTFGGTASGFEPLREMFEGITQVLRNEIDPSLAPLEDAENGYKKVRPIHILDIGNLIGNNVVVGGVRRTAEIFLMDADDYESIFAKYGINGFWNEKAFKQHEKIRDLLVEQGIEVPAWFGELDVRSYDPEINKDFLTNEPKREEDGSLSPFNFGRPLHHRRMSNNSVAFTKQPKREMLNLVFEMMQAEGEPGFINLEEARRRRPNAEGLNPLTA